MFDRNALKSLTREKGLNQLDLEAMTQIPQNTISRYMQGVYKPPPARVKLLADALEVSVEFLTIKESTEPSAAKPPAPKRQLCFCPNCGVDLKGVAQ